MEINLLLPYYLVEPKGVLSTSSMSHHLVEVLLSSSLRLGPLRIEVSADFNKGFLRNPRLLFPCGEGLLPLCELCLSCEEQFLQFLKHCQYRRHHGRARRKGRRKRPTQSKHGQINNALRNTFIYRKE
jgi:hypothetical protein